MSRQDVFSISFVVPPEVINAYFDGVAKVEAAKNKSSVDWSQVAALTPLLAPFLSEYIKSSSDSDVKPSGMQSACCDTNGDLVCSAANGFAVNKEMMEQAANIAGGLMKDFVDADNQQQQCCDNDNEDVVYDKDCWSDSDDDDEQVQVKEEKKAAADKVRAEQREKNAALRAEKAKLKEEKLRLKAEALKQQNEALKQENAKLADELKVEEKKSEEKLETKEEALKKQNETKKTEVKAVKTEVKAVDTKKADDKKLRRKKPAYQEPVVDNTQNLFNGLQQQMGANGMGDMMKLLGPMMQGFMGNLNPQATPGAAADGPIPDVSADLAAKIASASAEEDKAD